MYSEKTRLRNDLKTYTRELMDSIIRWECVFAPQIESLLFSLSMNLKNHKGKKSYGYLKPELKTKVNEIFNLLAQNGKVAELYKGWCEVQSEIIKSYRLDFDNLPSLTEQKEFHSIRNQIIKAAIEIQQTAEQKSETISSAPIPSSAIQLLNYLSKILYDSYQSKHKKAFAADRKLKSKTAEKKRAHGIRDTGEDEPEQGYNLSM